MKNLKSEFGTAEEHAARTAVERTMAMSRSLKLAVDQSKGDCIIQPCGSNLKTLPEPVLQSQRECIIQPKVGPIHRGPTLGMPAASVATLKGLHPKTGTQVENLRHGDGGRHGSR